MKLHGIEIDVVNNNGRMYPREVMEAALKEYQKKIDENRAFGELGVSYDTSVNLTQISHKVTKVELEGNRVGVVIEPLSTPQGKILSDMIQNKFDLGCIPRGIGKVTEDGRVWDYDIVSFDVLERDKIA